MFEELWKPIIYYDGLYEVSNFGNVRRINKTKEPRLLKLVKDKDGYYFVCLCKENNKKNKRINRLVAEAFIPNPQRFPVVNHKDGVKTNNRVDNLEWCTVSYNTKEAYRLGLEKPNCYYLGKKGKDSARARKVIQKDTNDNIINIYYGCLEASRMANINDKNINACCNGKRKKAGGYFWEWL